MPSTVSIELPDAFHKELAHFNVKRLSPSKPLACWQLDLHADLTYLIAEGHYIEDLRLRVKPQLPSSEICVSSTAFASWFEALAHKGPGQNHPLFKFLAADASDAQMRWFLTQEAAGEAGFEDLLALTQVKLPIRPKLECARNFWDEMGHGKQSAMHGHMLSTMVEMLDLQPRVEDTVWESLALSNTMQALAATRRYAYQSIGALGVIELTAPQRVRQVAAGMRRLGYAAKVRSYFDLHAALDVSHSAAWLREVIAPLVDADPACAPFIAEGALMRLLCGQRCFERYHTDFQRRAQDVEQPKAITAVDAPIRSHVPHAGHAQGHNNVQTNAQPHEAEAMG